jgi:hypothetical protein
MSVTDFLTRLIVPARLRAEKTTAHGWMALPGGRLELRATGFSIALCTKPRCHAYHLTDPENRMLASGHLLQPLKQFAEQCASDRAEFGDLP